MSKEDLLEEIEILQGYKRMYQKLNEQNKRYRELLEMVIDNGQCSTIDYISKELYLEESK